MARKIRLEELEIVVLSDAVDSRGSLKKKYVVHIGRVAHRDGQILSVACGTKKDVKWRYYLNGFGVTHLPVCWLCQEKVLRTADEKTALLLRDAWCLGAPVSNTGVNSTGIEGE